MKTGANAPDLMRIKMRGMVAVHTEAHDQVTSLVPPFT
jgi:hypothetical protein